jgi:hypothetical protein
MSRRVLVIGGYGTFGAAIARRLSREPNIALIIGGRSEGKARTLADELKAEWLAIDVPRTIDAGLEAARPNIVIHTSGPFQTQGYDVAEACIRHACHYIDLADARAFVANIVRLDETARAAGVLIVSGASSLPALTSAIVDRYREEFSTLESLDYGIATAQRTNRGLATSEAVLSYAGKAFTTLIDGVESQVYGWQSLRWRKFPGLGWRALGNCDVPDLALFHDRYPGLKTIRFQAGLELPVIHLSLWALTGLVRLGVLPNLAAAAPFLLALSRPFDFIGTGSSGFYMEMGGYDRTARRKRITFDLIARSGDGLLIPCVPAIVTALKLARGDIVQRGATPCIGIVDLDAILEEFQPLNIRWDIRRSSE